MKKSIANIIFFLPMYLINFLVAGKNTDYKKIDANANKSDVLKGASLEERNGFKILRISGSNYDMGFQYGYFLKEECLQNRRAWLDFCDKKLGITHKELQNAWDKVKNNIPQEYIEEFQGRADALNISLEDAALMDVMSMVTSKQRGCSIMAAWGSATSDGELYHLRTHDVNLEVAIDPVTRIPAYENRSVVVRKPKNGFASIFLSSSGDLGVEGGFNEKGICAGWSYSSSKDETVSGIPIVIRQLMALDHVSDLDKAVEIINSNRNFGCNVIVSDGKKSEAVVIEQNANNSYIGTWNNSVESNDRCWEIDHVIRRTNFFINSELADTQEGQYDRKRFFWPFWVIFSHYVALSKGIEQEWGKLDLNRTMEMLSSVYKGKTYLIFLMQNKYIWKREVTNQWVARPKTGDLLFSFAHNKKNSFETPAFNVNLFKLLDSK